MKRIYRNATETELIDLIKGDNKRNADNALLEIITRNESGLKFFIMRRVFDTQEREDIYNEALVRLWKKIHTFDPSKGQINTWLFTITNNLIIDSIRKKKSVLHLEDLASNSDNSENLETFDIPDYSGIASKRIEDSQRDSLVRSAINNTFDVDDPRRIVFELRFISELSYDEIAKITNYPIGSVKARIFRAREEFEKSIKKEAGSELMSLIKE